MKQYTLRIPSSFTITCCLIAILLSAVSCRKDKILTASDEDENYFVVKDNPNDPVDHAIYQFYTSTGIASFYNDTIHKKRVSDSEGQPRYSYITLSLSYTLFSTQFIYFKPVSNKSSIPALLSLLKQDLLPRLPENLQVPSFFFVDSIWIFLPEQLIDISDGFTSWHGFNTVAISVEDVEIMNAAERKMYAASLLAGLAERRLRRDAYENLSKDFFSISRTAAKAVTSMDIYSGYSFYMHGIYTPPPTSSLGFLKYFKNAFAIFMGVPEPVAPPVETEDLRAFLTAAFCYTTQEFDSIYSGKTLMLKKFNAIRDIAQKAGFQLPD